MYMTNLHWHYCWAMQCTVTDTTNTHGNVLHIMCRTLYHDVFVDPQGPFGSQATANVSPGIQTATTQLLTDPHAASTATAAEQQQQQLVAYVPPQLALLLRQLVAMLTEDARQTAEAAGGDLCEGGVRPEVTMSALQVRCCRQTINFCLKALCGHNVSRATA
jgi:hypothetical protein